MKKNKLLTIAFISLVFVIFCIIFTSKDPINKSDQNLSFATQINETLNKGAYLEEIENPGLATPIDIHTGQIKKYFKMENILFALVLRNSMNISLTLPSDFTPQFSGVLVAKQGDSQWSKLIELRDVTKTDKNNPYYLLNDNQKLSLTVVDQNGAGSGEGIMKVFALSDRSNWELENCYYFGENFSNPTIDGDYLAFSTNFSRQTPQPIESCNTVQLINSEQQ